MCIFPVKLSGNCESCGQGNAQCKTKFAFESSFCCKDCKHYYEGVMEVVHFAHNN